MVHGKILGVIDQGASYRSGSKLWVRDKAMDRLLRLEKEFGMTPSSRVRMVAIMMNPTAYDSEDPYDDEED